MKGNASTLSRRYKVALRTHLKKSRPTTLKSANGLGNQAVAAGIKTLDLARLHEKILVTELLPDGPPVKRARIIKEAGRFFTAVVVPIEQTHRGAQETTGQLKEFIEMLSQRTIELAASNLELSREVAQRKTAEEALRKSERHYSSLLEQSRRFQEELRRLSRQILSVQEDERKKISRELHDVIAQTLTGINVQLATLKKEALVNTKGLDHNIARAQLMVEKSVDIVHQFARELRPAVLDDLGLIPALHSFLKNFTTRTGVLTHLTTFAGVEQLDTTRRTVLFRVAQEALNNVSRHARASRVEVKIERLKDCICMTVKDDGKSFNVKRAFLSKGRKRLGLLGMRERIEMIGGGFAIESTPGAGTTIRARIPLVQNRSRERRVNRAGIKN
jgi:two-component system, NarL family, sensor histidine kinase DegS